MRKEINKIINMLIDPIVKAAVEERPPHGLESKESFGHRLRKQLNQSLKTFQQRFEGGINILKKHKKWVNHDFPDTLTSETSVLPQLGGLSNQELETYYTEGWNCYQEGSYENASHIFLFLSQMNPKVGSFWSALGAAEEKRGEVESAMHAFVMAAELENQTLSPYLHGAKCLLLLNRVEDAKKVLHRALERISEEPFLSSDKHLIEEMLKAIK